MSKRAVLVAATLLLGGGQLVAQVPAEERIPIRDPDRLQALGFPRDATAAFLWSKAGQGAKAAAAETPETWGQSAGFTMLMNSQFQGADPFNYWLVNGASQGSWCEGFPGGECLGYAQIEAPEGAILDRLDLWGYDDSVDSDMHYSLIESCEDVGGPTEVFLDSGDLANQDGNFHYFATYTDGPTIHNSQCGYTLRVKFTDGGEPPRSSAIRIRKARVTWRRQVSPAPATATFADVPADHPFFQFVEALVKSGITAGCGLDSYCPDAPLTRGQMAVFLSKALGLQWP